MKKALNKFLWIKFNVYSILLSLLALALLSILFFIPAIRYWWISIIIILISQFIFKKAKIIFGLYSYKVRVFYTLIYKAQNNFDQRYFVPYMGTACMRHVVFWALVETKHANEYSKIKKRFAVDMDRKLKATSTIAIVPPKMIDVSMQNGKLIFQEMQR